MVHILAAKAAFVNQHLLFKASFYAFVTAASNKITKLIVKLAAYTIVLAAIATFAFAVIIFA